MAKDQVFFHKLWFFIHDSSFYFEIHQENFKKSTKSKGKPKPQKANQKKNQNSKASKASFHESSMGLKWVVIQKEPKPNQINSQNLLYNKNLKLNQISSNHDELKGD